MDKQPRYGAVSAYELLQYWFNNYYVPEETIVLVDFEFMELYGVEVCVITLEDHKILENILKGYPKFIEVVKVSELATIWVEIRVKSGPARKLNDWGIKKDRNGLHILLYSEQ